MVVIAFLLKKISNNIVWIIIYLPLSAFGRTASLGIFVNAVDWRMTGAVGFESGSSLRRDWRIFTEKKQSYLNLSSYEIFQALE